MIKIPDSVLSIYILISLCGFLFRFVKDGVFKQLNFKPLISRLPIFSLVFLPFLALLFLAQQFSVSAGGTIPYFAGAALISYFLSGIGLPSYLRGLLLGGACVALTSLLPTDFISLAAALSGLLMAKLTENLAYGEESTLDDILPPFTWLTAIMWLSTVDSGKDLPLKAAVILGIMAVSTFMRFVQGPFVAVGNLQDDKLFVKRLVLSTTAGLGVLLVIVKVLNLMQYQSLALICGASYFISYLYKDLHGEDRYSLAGQKALRLLIFIGLLTLVSRLYGSFGILALAPTAMVAPLSSAALFPALYFASRVLLQVYLQHFNMNVTGINLTHTYAGAAQYAGFLFAFAILLLLKENMNRKVLLGLLLSACLLTPVLSNFILHAEPTCSLFVSALVSCFILAVLGPSLQSLKSNGAENIALAPALMISSGILSSGLLEMGNTATIAVKSTVLSYGIVFTLLLSFILWFIFQRGKNPPKDMTPVASGDGA
ncbi:MAG: hypothetical protein K2X27_09175 [Candidatus Obscuribacterales bacterium]|nr:hypothetical protein [Candidatus Obscuribacterales bacterium]